MNDEATAAAGKREALPRLTAAEWVLLLLLEALGFTHNLDYMIMMPLMPYIQHEMDISERQFGLLVASYAFSAGVSGLPAALFIDRFDRQRALLWLYFGFMVGTLLCAVAPGHVSLLLARTVAGAFGGVVSAVVLAIIGDVFSDRRRGRAMGVVMTAFSLALIVGLPIGLTLADNYGWRTDVGHSGHYSGPDRHALAARSAAGDHSGQFVVHGADGRAHGPWHGDAYRLRAAALSRQLHDHQLVRAAGGGRAGGHRRRTHPRRHEG